MLQIKNTLGGGKSNAPYAWAKYEVIPDEILTNPSIDLSYVESSGRINITGASFDLSFLPSVTNSNGLSLNGTDNEKQVVDFFTGFKVATNQYKFYLSNDVLTFYFEAGALDITEFHNDTDGTWFTVAVIGTYSAFEKTLPFTGEKIGRRSYHNFIEYITDKSLTKYPNGEVHTDGFFYRYAPEGLYAWKKNSLNTVEKATSTNATTKLSDATNATITYYTSSSYTFDEATGLFALDNPTEATLPYGSSKGMSNNIYFIVGSPSGETMFKGTSNNTSRLTQLRNNSNGLFVEPYSSSYTYTVYTAEQEATFLDYVVSDKENAYPDGGEKNGYWYERVVEGAKFTTGTVTPSSGDWLRVEHGLGVTPDIITVMAESSNTSILAYALHDIKRPDYALIGNLSGSTKVVTMYRDNTSYDKSSSYGCCNETFFSLPFYQYNTSWGTSLVYRWVCISFKE